MPLKSLNDGFLKADSRNLPAVDIFMLVNFFNSAVELAPETRRVKEARSTRASYGDDAVGYVQLKRSGGEGEPPSDRKCLVRAEVTPEHRVRAKGYSVHCTINETKSILEQVTCDDCVASEGICKHAVAFASWLQRRTDEPSCTSVACYWTKSSLSRVGTTDKYMLAEEMGKPLPQDAVPEGRIALFKEKWFEFMAKGNRTQLVINQLRPHYTLSMHRLLVTFAQNFPQSRVGTEFVKFCASQMTTKNCAEVAAATAAQSDSPLWFEMRYGRITASKFFEASRCQTADGVLVQRILGAKKFKKTKEMERGIALEPKVLQKVSTLYKAKMHRIGFVMKADLPLFGGSPDGLMKDWVVEVKCPATDKTFSTYFNADETEPAPKYDAQVQLQMKMCGRKKGLYCVAKPTFEKDKKVTIVEVNFKEDKFNEMISDATNFWHKFIFPKIGKVL